MSRRSFLRGNVLWLGIVSFFTDFSSEMIYPLLPFFLTTTLGAGAAFLGVIEGVAETTASVLKLFSGWFSDRVGKRKPLVLVGYGTASIVRPLISIATAPWQVLAIRFSDRVGKGIRTAPRDALLTDSVDPEVRGAAFGFHRAMDHAGAVAGPLAASALLFFFPSRYRLVFALAAVPALVSVLILAARVSDTSVVANSKPLRFASWREMPPRFRVFLLAVLLFTLGNATDAFLLLRAQQLGVHLAMIPLLWAALHVSKMTWSVPGGMLADRKGPRIAIVSGWLLYAAVYAAFAVASAAWHVWLLFVVYGLFYGLTESPEKALVASLAPVESRGAAFGTYHFVIGVAALPASVIFGWLWQRFGSAAALFTGAGIAIAATILFLLTVKDGSPDDGADRRRRQAVA